MFTARPLAPAMAVGALAAALVAGPTMAAAPASAAPDPLPQVAPAQRASSWLDSQLSPGGFVPSATTPGTADLAATANTVLALAATGDSAGARAALGYMKGQVDPYVTVDGSDGPGQLAVLILGAHALGGDPRSFGGTDLVNRLLATQRAGGPDAGLFGAQDSTYDGAYRQSLALAALASAGVTSGAAVTAAESWLESQQCPDGGWTSYITSTNPCNGDPAAYEGPDTNSTALAVEGLADQGALSHSEAAAALGFLAGAQDADGGWGYEPNAADAPGSTDPDSTALVIQGLLAMGASPSDASLQRGADDPVSALLSFVVSSGSGAGAFFYPGSTSPDILATYQAIPAAAGVVFPFVATSTTASVSPASVTKGTPVAYSAAVDAGGTNPVGSVTFTVGSTRLCTATTSAGRAACSSSAAPVGSDAVTATFSGGADFGLSSSTATVEVDSAQDTSSAPSTSGTASSAGSAIAGATTVDTGAPFAGDTVPAASVGATGVLIALVGWCMRRRSRSLRSS